MVKLLVICREKFQELRSFCWIEVQWCTLTTTDYRRSPLVQGGLEIACKVTVKMVATVKNHMLIERYLQLVKTLYAEPKNEVILGSFFARLDAPPKQIAKNINDPFPKKTPKTNRDIRTMFAAKSTTLKKKTENMSIVID